MHDSLASLSGVKGATPSPAPSLRTGQGKQDGRGMQDWVLHVVNIDTHTLNFLILLGESNSKKCTQQILAPMLVTS